MEKKILITAFFVSFLFGGGLNYYVNQKKEEEVVSPILTKNEEINKNTVTPPLKKENKETVKEEKPKVNESVISEKEREDSYNDGVYLSSQISGLVALFLFRTRIGDIFFINNSINALKKRCLECNYNIEEKKEEIKKFKTKYLAPIRSITIFLKSAVILYIIAIPIAFSFFMKSNKKGFLPRLFDVYDKFCLKSWKRSIIFTLLWFVFSYLLIFLYWVVVNSYFQKKFSEILEEV